MLPIFPNVGQIREEWLACLYTPLSAIGLTGILDILMHFTVSLVVTIASQFQVTIALLIVGLPVFDCDSHLLD